MSDNLLSRVQASLLGVMIGDAMGMPWETMTPEQILKATDSKGVTGFHDPVQRKIPDTMDKKAGDATDDWQLTAVNAESLIRCNGFNLVDIALAHIEARESDEFGWGGTTRRAIDEVKEYFDSRGKGGRAPWTSPPVRKRGGCGNGVAMKIAPISLWGALRRQDMKSEIMKLGLMTHFDLRASITAVAIDYCIRRALAGLIGNPYDIVRQLGSGGVLEGVERNNGKHTVKSQFDRIWKEGLLDDPIALREKIGTDCFAMESVPFAIATFLRHPTDFRTGVIEAVNAGGDMDTTASMVGAMVGANCGLDAIPDEWKNFRPEFAEPLELGERLYRVALDL